MFLCENNLELFVFEVSELDISGVDIFVFCDSNVTRYLTSYKCVYKSKLLNSYQQLPVASFVELF